MVTQGMRDRDTLPRCIPWRDARRRLGPSIPRCSRSTSTSAARTPTTRIILTARSSIIALRWKPRGGSVGALEVEHLLPQGGQRAREAQRFVARTAATACVSAPPIGRRQLCAPRPPGWPIAPDSIRARDEARESARRSPWAHWSKSMARDDRLGGPSDHSTTAETPWQRRESHALGAVERWSGCHRSPAVGRPAPPPAAS